MFTKTTFTGPLALLSAATVASLLFAGGVAASDSTFAVALKVSSQGLDLSQPKDAQTFYERIEHAAQVVCTHGMQVALAPVADRKGCQEKALGDAIRSAKVPMLTQIYLTNHTPRDAAAYGIEVPSQLAAR